MTVLKPHPENADQMPGGLISLVRDSKLWLKAPVFQEMKVYAVSRGLMMCRRVSKMKWDVPPIEGDCDLDAVAFEMNGFDTATGATCSRFL